MTERTNKKLCIEQSLLTYKEHTKPQMTRTRLLRKRQQLTCHKQLESTAAYRMSAASLIKILISAVLKNISVLLSFSVRQTEYIPYLK